MKKEPHKHLSCPVLTPPTSIPLERFSWKRALWPSDGRARLPMVRPHGCSKCTGCSRRITTEWHRGAIKGAGVFYTQIIFRKHLLSLVATGTGSFWLCESLSSSAISDVNQVGSLKLAKAGAFTPRESVNADTGLHLRGLGDPVVKHLPAAHH